MIHTVIDSPDSNFYMNSEMRARSNSANIPSTTAHAQVPAALEKTRMCVYFLQGRCKYDDCSFAHSVHELKQAPSNLRKTKICDLFMMGHCTDAHCNFAHSTEELKVKSKRSASSTGASLLATHGSASSPSLGSPTNSNSVGEKTRGATEHNVESCARTILSMLIKMQPEAAVAFLSNPECKVMLQQLLERPDTPSRDSSVPTSPPQIPMDECCSSSTTAELNSASFLFSSPTGSDIGSFQHSPPGLILTADSNPAPINSITPTPFASYSPFGITP